MTIGSVVKSFSLRIWVPLTLLSLVCAVLLFFQFNLWQLSSKRHQEQSFELVKTLLATLSRNISHDLRVGYIDDIPKKLISMASMPSVNNLFLIDENGQIVFSNQIQHLKLDYFDYFTGDEYALPESATEPQIVRTVNDGEAILGFQQVLLPSSSQLVSSSQVAWLLIEYDLSTSNAKLRRDVKVYFVFFFAVAISILLVVFWVANFMLIRPLRLLAEYARNIKKGDFPEAIRVKGRGEVAELASALVEMSESIHNHVDRLRLQAATLETQVEQRTKDLQLAVSEANAASNAKSVFLANMSHEIRTPLNGISGGKYLLEQTVLTPKQQKYLQRIDKSALVLMGVINDVLDLSKIESGKFTLEKLPCDLFEVMEIVLEVVAFRAADKSLDLTFDIAPDLPALVECDALRLKEILINLINNAIKFTDSGFVSVDMKQQRIDQDSIKLMVSVRDSGIGISQDQQKSLFKAFTQADSSITRRFGGTGLGLSICKSLIELMGGKISVESQKGEGAHFHFELPLKVSSWDRDTVSGEIPSQKSVTIISRNYRLTQQLVDSIKYFGFSKVQCEADLSCIDRLNGNDDGMLIIDWDVCDVSAWPKQIEHLLQCEISDQLPKVFVSTSKHQKTTEDYVSMLANYQLMIQPFLPSHFIEIINKAFLPSAVSTQQETASATQAISFKGLSVLLVEDTQINQEIFLEILESFGVQADLAENGQEALDRLDQADNHYDVVLMDVQMPIMDGYTAMAKMQEMPELADIPVIVLTANVFAKDKKTAINNGAFGFLGKPLDVDELVDIFQKLVQDFGIKIEAQDLVQEPSTNPNDLILMTDSSAQNSRSGQGEVMTFDIEQSLARLNGNMRIYGKILARFYSAKREHAAELESLFKEDIDAAHREAHSLKGLCQSLGFVVLATCYESIELFIKEKHFDQLTAQFENLKQHLEAVFEVLDTLPWLSQTIDIAAYTKADFEALVFALKEKA